MTNEQNKKVAINAGLFLGSIVLGTMLGWGAWLWNNQAPLYKSAAPAEADALPTHSPAVPARPARTTPPVVAATPAVPVAVAAPAPTAQTPTRTFRNPQATSPEQQQQMIQNLAQNLARSQDPRAQELAAQMQTPEGQQQLREQAATLLQQFRRGGPQGGQGFPGQRIGGPNPANPPLPADVAAVEDNTTDGG